MKMLIATAVLTTCLLVVAAVLEGQFEGRGKGVLIYSSLTNYEMALRCDDGQYMVSLHHDCGRRDGVIEILPYTYTTEGRKERFTNFRLADTDIRLGIYPYIRFSSWIPVGLAVGACIALALKARKFMPNKSLVASGGNALL